MLCNFGIGMEDDGERKMDMKTSATYLRVYTKFRVWVNKEEVYNSNSSYSK